MKDSMAQAPAWSENIIIADADYVDGVAFNLIVNFERMIGRRIPQADTARWLDCIALDGGVREGDNHTQAIFVHTAGKSGMENFAPGKYDGELSGKAFSDNLGEFVLNAVSGEQLVEKNDLLLDLLQTACAKAEVKRVMLIPNAEDAELYAMVQHALRNVSDDKRVTVFAMQPMPGGNFRQEILGYSLMNALGIRSDELKG